MCRHWSLVLGSFLVLGCAQPTVVVSRQLGTDIELPLDSHTIVSRVARGSTLGSMLSDHGLAETLVTELVARASEIFDVRKVRVDQPYRIVQSMSGILRRFEYEIDGDRLLEVAASDAGALVARMRPIPKTTRAGVVRGQIDREASSLFAAMGRAGEGVDLSIALADVFGSEVDFNTELQPGDAFSLVVEKQYREDQAFGGYGAIQVATLENDGRRLQAFRFAPEGSAPGYFDAAGVSLRRFFLRSPLKFEPSVSSGFSPRRLHPVLHEYRAHLGVDYRAPIGAPVIAVAHFRAVGTQVMPTSERNDRLVTTGLYAFTRNPMYLGLVIAALGVALWFGRPLMYLAPILVFLIANFVFAPYEEAKMRRQFGEAFDAYAARVRRWL